MSIGNGFDDCADNGARAYNNCICCYGRGQSNSTVSRKRLKILNNKLAHQNEKDQSQKEQGPQS